MVVLFGGGSASNGGQVRLLEKNCYSRMPHSILENLVVVNGVGLPVIINERHHIGLAVLYFVVAICSGLS